MVHSPLLMFDAASSASVGWIVTLNASSYSVLFDISSDSSGNVYSVGYYDFGGNNRMLVTKHNTSGVIQWQRRLGDTVYEVANAGKIDSSGNVYLVGYGSVRGGIEQDIVLAKYDSNGTLQWQRSLGTSAGDEYGQSLGIDGSGNVIVTGVFYISNKSEMITAKYNSSGTIQWQRSLGLSAEDFGQGVACDSSGNVYVCGATTSQGQSAYNYLIVKYNSSGTLQWQRAFGSSSDDISNGIAVDSSGNVYVTGYSVGVTSGTPNMVLVKYDGSGNVVWQKAIGGSNTVYGRKVATDSSGNIYVCADGANVGRLFKYNSSGSLQWQRVFDGSGLDTFQGVAVDNLGSVYSCGYTNSQGLGWVNGMIVKVPDTGAGTGTYSPFSYSASGLSEPTPSLVNDVISLTDAAGTLTSATTSFTSAASTLTSTVIPI